MSRSVAEAAQGAGEVARNIQGVAEAAQSTSHGATDSQKAAKSLAKMSTHLRGLVGQFKLNEHARQSGYRGRDGAAANGRTEEVEEVENELVVR